MSKLREHSLLVGLFALGLALVVRFVIPSPPVHAATPALVTVGLNQEFLDSYRLLRAFVPTGSLGPAVCSVTDNYPYYGAVRLQGMVLLCRPREIDGEEGVGITIVLPPTFDTNQELNIDVTVFQETAVEYGPHRPCPGAC
jgi:hypothetical protein